MDENLILVVDDDPDIRTMLVDLLQLNGYSVCVAGNGAEALKSIDNRSPELVILDLWMPVLNGAEFVRELDRRGIDLPILVMTAAPNPTQLASDLGVAGYLQKPFELFDLLDSVKRLCPAQPVQTRRRSGAAIANRVTNPDHAMPNLLVDTGSQESPNRS
jgi:two-component system response regulator MprA